MSDEDNEGGKFEENEESIRERLKQAKNEVEELGGWESFKSGIWLVKLIGKSFRNLEHSDAVYFRHKYPHLLTSP